MPLTVRLPAEVELKLKSIARIEKKSKTDIIKESLDLYFERINKSKSAFELGKHLFGKYGSEKGNLSMDGEKLLREKLNAKKHP